MSAYPKSHNPFADDDEGEDEAPENRESESERRQRQLQVEAMRTAQSAVDSSHRSLRLIYDAEKTGAETAEELMRQGEALKRTERMVDNMEQDLKTSQKHINTIKSVWGGFVNYFKTKPETKPAPEQPVGYEPSNKLQDALANSKEHQHKYQESHPSLRKLDTSAFGAAGFSSEDSLCAQNGYPKNRYLRDAHKQLDDNLDEMSHGLSRLKNLGMGLQGEIEDQDVSLDNLLNKVDRMDGKINATNQQLKSLR